MLEIVASPEKRLSDNHIEAVDRLRRCITGSGRSLVA